MPYLPIRRISVRSSVPAPSVSRSTLSWNFPPGDMVSRRTGRIRYRRSPSRHRPRVRVETALPHRAAGLRPGPPVHGSLRADGARPIGATVAIVVSLHEGEVGASVSDTDLPHGRVGYPFPGAGPRLLTVASLHGPGCRPRLRDRYRDARALREADSTLDSRGCLDRHPETPVTGPMDGVVSLREPAADALPDAVQDVPGVRRGVYRRGGFVRSLESAPESTHSEGTVREHPGS